MGDLENGMMVQHASLGLGKIVALEERAVHVFFAMSDARFATKLRLPMARPFLTPAPSTNAWLSRLSGFTFDAKAGRYGLGGTWLSHADAAARFLEVFPKGFADPGYAGDGADKRDRVARWLRAHEAYLETLGGGEGERLLAAGDVGELVERALRVERGVRALHKDADKTSFEDALRDSGAARDYFAALFEFLTGGLGADRCSRLLFVETTVEPQYPGACRVGDKDPRRAFLDFNEAAHRAFDRWQERFSESDPHRTQLVWPTNGEQRDRLLRNRLFNDFRACGLAQWVSEDAKAIRSVARDVYIAVEYNGRFDDKHSMRVGTRDVFLTELKGIDIIQIAPHPPVWTTMSWDDVIAVNRKAGKHWAISEHMSATGSWGQDDQEMTAILENTLARGTRFGWDLVNAGNRHAQDDYHLYDNKGRDGGCRLRRPDWNPYKIKTIVCW